MSATIVPFPRPDDDDADFSELMWLDISRFVLALEKTPVLKNGFGLHDVHKVEQAWEFLDTECLMHGYIVELVDGRRVLLEYQDGDEAKIQEILNIEPLAPGAMPEREVSDTFYAPWYAADHITMHIAELKLVPPDAA